MKEEVCRLQSTWSSVRTTEGRHAIVTGLGDVYRATRRLGFGGVKQTYYHAAEGHFPPGVVVRVGRRLLFDMRALDEWIIRGGQVHLTRARAPKRRGAA